MGYSPWGHKESDMTDLLTLSLFTFNIFTHTRISECIFLIQYNLYIFSAVYDKHFHVSNDFHDYHFSNCRAVC